MIGIDITAMIFTILSFLATVGLTITLFLIDSKNQKRRDKEELEQKARDFINRNIDELEYLPLAQFAYIINSKIKHSRKIYNEYNRIYNSKLRQEILKQAEVIDLNLAKLKKDEIKYNLIELFEKDAQELGLMTQSFLYDGAKYFHRGFYDWGMMKICGNLKKDEKNREDKNNYFEKKYYKFDKNNYFRRDGEDDIWFRLLDFIELKKCENKIEYYERAKIATIELFQANNKNIYSYLVPNTFNEFKEIHKIPPLDWYWSLITTCPESECTYIVMEMVLQATYINKRELYNDIPYLYEVKGGFKIERNEDLYYSALLNLYCTYADKILKKL